MIFCRNFFGENQNEQKGAGCPVDIRLARTGVKQRQSCEAAVLRMSLSDGFNKEKNNNECTFLQCKDPLFKG